MIQLMSKKNIYGALLALMVSTACMSQTARINFEAPDMYPEGVAFDEGGNRFFVSSVRTGTIGTVDPKGAYSVFYADSSLKSTYGMKVDAARRKLWVCSGDANYSKYADSATYKKMIRLIGLDLASGRKTDDIDLSGLYPGRHFANDLALDNSGNIYITDSHSPVVYKVDPSGKASVFAQSDWFKGQDVGLNGIVWSPRGYLIVANGNDGNLYKIDITDPRRVTRIRQKTFFPGADGLLWDKDGNLVLLQNEGTNKVLQLSSSDDWQSTELKGATATNDRFHYPSTAAMQKGVVYALNAKLSDLTDPTAQPAKDFSLQMVRFLPAK